MFRLFLHIGYILFFTATVTFAGTVDTAQRMLNQLGYNAGAVDGAYGKKTRAALERFYSENGGSFDGKLDANEVADLQAAMTERGIKSYVPLSSYDVQRQWTVNPTKADLTVTEPRHSIMVGQGVFWFGPRTKFADFNGDGIDDIVTVGVSAKAFNDPDFKPGGRCDARTDPSKFGFIAGCNGKSHKIKPKIAYGKADGTYEWSSDEMFIHPPAKGNKIPGYAFANGVLVADYNGDDIPDIFVHDSSFGWDGDYQSLYLSNPDGTWTYSTFSNVKGVKKDFGHGGTTGDIDGDGDIDILVTKQGKGLACYFNDGTGNFKYKSQCYSGMITYTVSLADVDGDGDLDAYVGSNSYNGKGGVGQYGGGYRILENNGKGSFRDKIKLPQVDCWVSNPVSEPVDIDRDGDMDFVASFTGESYAFAAIQIIRNDGNWNFSQETVQITSWKDMTQTEKDNFKIGHGNDECGFYEKNHKNNTWNKSLREGHFLNGFIEQLTFADANGDGEVDVILSRPTAMHGWDKAIDKIQGGYLENGGAPFHQFYQRSFKHWTDIKRLRY